jgi:dihydrofolate synthase / folylpolyglutamate synthase
LDWLFAQLPMYQRVGMAAYKTDLSNTQKLAEYLNHPEKEFKSIHVAGTNGKGSTSHMLASILQEAGYKVGLYTSPHLKDFRERIKINGEMISKRSVSEFVTKNQTFFEADQLSFFEMTVGLAFDEFRRKGVDIAVIEVGLGGRLDSTNIITPEVSVITNIGLDHTRFLGDTLVEIATEKAGIIKTNIPVVVGERNPETDAVFEEISEKNNALICFAEDEKVDVYPSDLLGNYQRANQRTALSALKILRSQNWNVSEEHIRKGLLNVVANTRLLGRWQLLGLNPKVICDTAHNREGLSLAMVQLQGETYDKLHIVLGVVNDKQLERILPLFPKQASYYFCEPNIPRALKTELLQKKAAEFGLDGRSFFSVRKAYKEAVKSASAKDLVYVGGSTFVVAEIL